MQSQDEIDVKYLETSEQLADIFTKPLTKDKYTHLVQDFVHS